MNKENVAAIYPLSPLQQGILFECQYANDNSLYYEQQCLTLKGKLEPETFQQAWQEVVSRHPSLRTLILWENRKAPLQVVRKTAELGWQHEDWQGLSPAEQETRLQSFLEADRQRGFALTLAPLMRCALIKIAENTHHFVWSAHHIIIDGWCTSILYEEAFALYHAKSTGQTLRLPPARPYQDYIAWLQKQDQALAEQFWRRELQGFTAPTPLIADRPKHLAKGNRPCSHEIAIPDALKTALQGFGRQQQLTLNTLFMGAWAILLSRYAREEDIVFGVTVSGRPGTLPGVEKMVGLFINTLPARIQVSAESHLSEWLQTLQISHVEREEYAYSALSDIQKWSDLPSGSRLFESLFVFENYPDEEDGDTQLNLTNTRIFEHTSFPLSVAVTLGETIGIAFLYKSDRFNPDTIARMAGHYRQLLHEIVHCPHKQLWQLQLLTAAEKQQILIEWNQTQTAYPADKCLQQLFEEQAAQTPNRIALVDGTKQLTYHELNTQANQLAHYLSFQGVQTETLVGLYLERSSAMIIAILAILKAGGVYLPLDTGYPQARIELMIKDAEVPLLLTQENFLDQLDKLKITTLCMDRDWDVFCTHQPTTNPASCFIPDHPAYVMYTSGSTGTPKGVVVTHRNIVRLVKNTNYIDFRPDRTLLQLASVTFDAATFEIWASLLNGAKLVITTKEIALSPEKLANYLHFHQIDTLFLTTALFNQISQIQPDCFAELDTLLFGGEQVDPKWVKKILDTAPPKHLLHVYGPTENTTFSSWHEIKPGEIDAEAMTIPIGTPISNTKLYLLDNSLQPVPVGVVGELYTGGDGVACGYLNRQQLSSERFITNPFSEGLLYKTGDLARYLPDGAIEFMGRLDNQVKIRGYRIELGEIESVINQHPLVRDCVVRALETSPGQKRLVAYVIPVSTPAFSVTDLRESLQQTLPDYMVPNAFVPLESFTLTPNGKIDDKSLPIPSIIDKSADYEAPVTAAETCLAALWQDILQTANVGLNDNFFELGGDSIISLQLISRAKQAGLHITPKDIFSSKTLRQLAAVAKAINAIEEADQAPVIGDIKLLPIQHWFFDLRQPDPHHFNQANCFIVPAQLDLQALTEATRHLLAHHDMLRAYYRQTEADWQQAVAAPDKHPFAINYFDLSMLPQEHRVQRLSQQAASLQASLTLDMPPLMCMAWFDYGPTETGRLVWIIHHLLVDGVSWRILEEDLNSVYQAACQGKKAVLSAKTTSFRRWANALADYSHSPRLLNQAGYWEALAQQKNQPLPVDYSTTRVGNTIASTAEITCCLNPVETRALLQEIPSVYRTHINDLLLTALAMAFRPYTGSDTLWLDMETHGRHNDIDASADMANMDLSRTVGWFTSMFPLRLQLDQRELGANIKSIKEQLRRVPMQGMGYGLLCAHGKITALEQSAKPEIGFNYLGQFDQGHKESLQTQHDRLILGQDEMDLGHEWSPRQLRQHLLDLNGWVSNSCLQFTWSYSENFHKLDTVLILSEAFIAALQMLIAHCQSTQAGEFTPSDFPLLTSTQQQLDKLVKTIMEANKDIPAVIESIYPPTPSQQGMLLETLAGTTKGMHVEQQVIPLQGQLDIAAFKRAWQHLLDRHAMLRSGFVWMNQLQPLQYTLQKVPVPMSVDDWRRDNDRQQQDRLADLLETDRQQGFILEKAPLLRIRLLKTGDHSHQLVLTLHHALVDGWSLSILREELFQCYEAEQSGHTPKLPAAPAFSDFIAWLQRQDMEQTERFWREYLQGFSHPILLRGKAPPQQEPGYGKASAMLDSYTAQNLQALARQQQLTTSTLIQGCWALLLSHYSGQDDIVFGATVSGRPPGLTGAEKIIGMFINTLPVRVKISKHKSLWLWLADLHNHKQEQQAHEYCSAGQVHQWSGIPSMSALYESLLVYENYPVSEKHTGQPTLSIGESNSLGAQTHYPLTLMITSTAMGMDIQMVYYQAYYTSADAAQILDDLLHILQAMSQSQATTVLADMLASPAIQPTDSFLEMSGGTTLPVATPKQPPRDAVERELTDIWQEVFHHPVGIEDSFFDLGGHSLLAIQLMTRIEQAFQRNLPITQLFKYPTIAQLAAMLKAQTTMSVAEDSFISMGGEGDRIPLFLLPGGGSDPIYFYELTRHLASDQPIYGLRPAGLDGKSTPSRSVEEAAAYHIKIIRELQAQGPYQLLGHSSGAHIAFEIAQQLMREGEEIKLFAALDMPAPIAIHSLMQFPDKDDLQYILDYAETMQPYTRQKLDISREMLEPLTESERIAWLKNTLEKAKLLLPETDGKYFINILDVARCTADMIPKYRPNNTLPLSILLFRVTEKVHLTGSMVIPVFEQDAGWDRFGQTKAYAIPGNHFNLVNEPHVGVLAEKLKPHLANTMDGKIGKNTDVN